jgi:hypothetical protein
MFPQPQDVKIFQLIHIERPNQRSSPTVAAATARAQPAIAQAVDVPSFDTLLFQVRHGFSTLSGDVVACPPMSPITWYGNGRIDLRAAGFGFPRHAGV